MPHGRPSAFAVGTALHAPVTDIGHVLVDHSRAFPIPKNIHQQRKGRGGLPPARIVEVVARIVRAPIRQHSLEAALGKIWLRHILRHVGHAEPAQRRIEHLEGAVEDELAFDVNPHLAAVLLELPGVQSAPRGQTQIDAIVTNQVLRPLRF